MEKELKSVVWDKYMGTDFDSVTLFFVEGSKSHLVGEFEVPENEMHSVYYCGNYDDGDVRWIEIVDPQSIIGKPNSTLPDIKIKTEGKSHSLYDFINIIV